LNDGGKLEGMMDDKKCTCRMDGNHGVDATGCPVHSRKAITQIRNARLLELAKSHPPPQAWMDEDEEKL
jgi:hypothetical protein